MKSSKPASEGGVFCFCGERFRNYQDINQHVCRHEKGLDSTICNRRFSCNSHLQGHNDESSYTSFKCNARFTDKHHLQKHAQNYTGERPYTCVVCNKRFQSKRRLNVHISIHNGKHSNICDMCGKQFSRKANLYTHMLIHSGTKSHVCDICGKQFVQKGNLNTHKLIHCGKKSHVCNICGKQFVQKGNLNTHHLIHSGKKPHGCDICRKHFTQKGHLIKHLQYCNTENFAIVGKKLAKNVASDKNAINLANSTTVDHTRSNSFDSTFCGVLQNCESNYRKESPNDKSKPLFHSKLSIAENASESPSVEAGKYFDCKTRNGLQLYDVSEALNAPWNFTSLENGVFCKSINDVRLNHSTPELLDGLSTFNKRKKRVIQKVNLNVCSLVRSEKKPHICNICGKRFIQIEDLDEHFQICKRKSEDIAGENVTRELCNK